MGHAKEGSLDDLGAEEDPSILETPDWWRLIDHLKVKAFVEITVARTIREGIQQVIFDPILCRHVTKRNLNIFLIF